MREINLDRLRTLLTVADLGSFAAAAKALHLAPPTVTLHVALEARLRHRDVRRQLADRQGTAAAGRSR
jgi:DNA-binding transcriptional LysR family regulator